MTHKKKKTYSIIQPVENRRHHYVNYYRDQHARRHIMLNFIGTQSERLNKALRSAAPAR